jgi:hypothetical protein
MEIIHENEQMAIKASAKNRQNRKIQLFLTLAATPLAG